MSVMKKQPNDYPRIAFRLSEELKQSLSERTEERQSQDSVAKRDLEAYYDELPYALPQFSEQDALLICGELNGARISPETLHYLRRDVIDAAMEQNKQELAQRLQNLSRFEWRAIVDAVQRYWIGPYHKDSEMSAARLREVGLVEVKPITELITKHIPLSKILEENS